MADDDGMSDLDPEIRARLAAVQARLAAGENDLSELIGAEMAAAHRAFQAATLQPDKFGVHGKAVFEAIHDIKGIGGTFGYDLVSAVAGNLHDFLLATPLAPERVLPVIEAHLRALDEIRRENLSGDGGERGRRMLAELKLLV